MSFSDDDAEVPSPLSISNYYFNDEEDEAVCFSHLPLQIAGKECLNDGSKKKIFLRGTEDGGLFTICKHVTAWKFDLSNVGKPEISVLSKENGWIKLQKPRESFEPVIRSVLITVHCLHLLSRNPNLLGESLWEQLAKTFSLHEVKPSLNDLVDHMDLIAEAVKCDASLEKSKYLQSFLEEKPKKSKLADENARATSGFIVDDDGVDGPELDASNRDDEEDDLYDSVCALCDNGGDLLCCEGRCMRSFHPTKDEASARESACVSLGFTPKQVKAMLNFLCKNCEYNQHQCFACGELGSSDKSSDAEVFRCSNATCGRFYHPHCVAKLLHKEDKVAAEEHGKKISAGEHFTCPTHKCCVCQQGEDKKVVELQFALCRRCPTAYHRKCLPREIAFKDIEEEDIKTRAWEKLVVNRILIYCLKHEIDDDLGTPKRGHIKFPFDEGKKRKAPDVLISIENIGLKKKTLEDTSQGKNATKPAKQYLSVEQLLDMFDDRMAPIVDPCYPDTYWFVGYGEDTIKRNIRRILKSDMPQLYYNWKETPSEQRDRWWASFVHTYRWPKSMTHKVRCHFEELTKVELREMMSDARRKYKKDPTKFPRWTTNNIRQQLVERWNSDAFKAKCAINWWNQLAERVSGEGGSSSGSGYLTPTKQDNIYFQGRDFGPGDMSRACHLSARTVPPFVAAHVAPQQEVDILRRLEVAQQTMDDLTERLILLMMHNSVWAKNHHRLGICQILEPTTVQTRKARGRPGATTRSDVFCFSFHRVCSFFVISYRLFLASCYLFFYFWLSGYF